MSYELKLWRNIAKKINSTYQVTSQPDITTNVELKEETSLENPTFLLDLDDWSVNYCQFQGHYYFIQDIRRNITGQMEIECTQDVLATYKSQIGNYTAFVERSSYEYDERIADNAISTRYNIAGASHETITLTDVRYDYLSQTGCYLLRTVSQIPHAATSTGITTYVLDESDIKTIFDFMFNDGNYGDVLSDAAVKSFFNPFQYIVDFRWIPYTKATMHDILGVCNQSGTVMFGWFNTQHSAYILTGRNVTTTFSLACPTCAYNPPDFRRYDPAFTRFKLYIFGVGTIDLSPLDVSAVGITIRRVIDFTTGQMIHYVRKSDGIHPIGEFTSDFAIPVQISQVNSNLVDSALNVVKTVGQAGQAIGIASSGGAAGIATAAIGGVVNISGSIFNAIRAEASAGVQGNGSNGNRAALMGMPYYILYQMALDSADIPQTVAGRPLYRNRQISTIPGSIKCSGASVNISGFAGDKEAVNSALNGGFYYE